MKLKNNPAVLNSLIISTSYEKALQAALLRIRVHDNAYFRHVYEQAAGGAHLESNGYARQPAHILVEGVLAAPRIPHKRPASIINN